jgi:Cysteine-rich CPCC
MGALMRRGDVTEDDFGHSVEFILPSVSVESQDRIASTLHQLDRRLGVIRGRQDGGARLILLLPEPDGSNARRRATELVRQACEREGVDPQVADRAQAVDVTRRRLSPGRAGPVSIPPEGEGRRAALPDGRVLRAVHDGPLGNWTVFVEGDRQAWSARALVAALRELFDLPHGRTDDWVHDIVRQLAGRETPHGTRYACPCCDNLTLVEAPPGSFDICPVCGWEDDSVQFDDPDYAGGANRSSLREARDACRRTGASED